MDEKIWSDCDRDLATRIKGLIGVTADVKTVKPGSIERSMGKAKRVNDLRGKT
jgi:phenylacetate-CoA ligase